MKRLFLPVLLLLPSPLLLLASDWEITTSDSGFTVTIDDQLFARYVTDQANKPYFYPIIGPTGASMTRAWPMEDIPGEKQDHPHHRGINFGHQNVNGYDTWVEANTWRERRDRDPEAFRKSMAKLGATVHLGYKSMKVTDDSATVVVQNKYVDAMGNTMMLDERTYTFCQPDADARILDVAITLYAPPHGVTHLGDIKDAGLSIRVPHAISVDAGQGGLLINSEGVTNEDSWGKQANWCDYNGTIDGQKVGIAFMNHPNSFRYPTFWHARTYGLLTANPFGTKEVGGEGDGTLTLSGDESIKLKHRFLFHKGDHKQARIAEAWDDYAGKAKYDRIFNGKNLDGWNKNNDCWTVRDGILYAKNDPEQKGDILQTKKHYRNFVFQADFKFGAGKVDTGIFLRDTKEQIQIGESGSLKRDMTALPYIPGKGYPIQVDTAQEVFDMGNWNRIKIRVKGNTYTTWLNGKKIMTYESDTIIPEGPIGIQVHPKREMSVQYRNLLAREIPD